MGQIWFTDRLFEHTTELEQNKGRPVGSEEGTVRELSCMCCTRSIRDSTPRFVWAFFWALKPYWSIALLLVLEFDLDMFDLRYFAWILGSAKPLKCWFKCEIKQTHPYVVKQKNIYCKTEWNQQSSPHTSDGSAQHAASLMNKVFYSSLPNCATMS